MSNVVPFQPTGAIETEDSSEPRKPYSFDMVQTDHRGMVLIDACVPAAMATAFLEILISFQDKATAV